VEKALSVATPTCGACVKRLPHTRAFSNSVRAKGGAGDCPFIVAIDRSNFGRVNSLTGLFVGQVDKVYN
jgi:hypothetical protein